VKPYTPTECNITERNTSASSKYSFLSGIFSHELFEENEKPKLELYGCYRALRNWRLYLVGVKKLIVEVDAKYIKDMLNNPELQPNAAINRWIQGILLFDFELRHIPGEKHRGPDALSRKEPAEEDWEEAEIDEDWLDEIVLWAQANYVACNMPKNRRHAEALPSFKLSPSDQDQSLKQIREFLRTLQLVLEWAMTGSTIPEVFVSMC
jgi:hypothetical protein